jgi:transposase
MDGDRIEMSLRERDVLKVMSTVLEGRRTQKEAARLLQRSVRQVRRLRRRLEREGDAAVIHGLRGRPSNRRLGEELRREVLRIYRREYGDFGPTLASEKLSQRGLEVSRSTLHRWLVEAGLWKGRRRRAKHRSRRPRRACFGEMVQADGSVHEWLEGRGEAMTLLVLIDDATSKTVAKFHPAETTEGYMELLKTYLRKHGRMVSLYADRHSIFQAPPKFEGEPAEPTQFARALAELGIELIPAHSPQAKGRVERFNGTAQDRLVKELRLAGACTIDEANGVLKETFLPWFNRWCTVKPASATDAHRRLYPTMNLAAILSHQDQRTVANDYTIRYHGQTWQLPPPALPGLRGGKVTVERRLDGTTHVRFKGKYLKYEPVIGEDKALGAPPPDPRSLSHQGIPAEEGAAGGKGKGRAAAAAQPSAVHPPRGRSGRTPAEPCPPSGKEEHKRKRRYRPPANHPWRKRPLTPAYPG